ncbi:hypothetical protein PCANC_21756 [Puccinia coronata f. sp. avenae]|uniref:Uncharacterized protein n=1 Tax=Puccinia coronata f. sp. avenae TaxID=200324 RepID=A0A2N5SKG5_9BASI|nr:hypothetical protein PCANC_21756 [Puccinia coronata f. sp. avenae]
MAASNGTWLKALINEIWDLKIKSALHYIDNIKLNNQLTTDDITFKEKYCVNHFINNKGLDDKLKRFGSNAKTCHINLCTKGMCQEIKAKKIKVVLIRTHEMIADALTKPAPILSLSRLTKTIDPIFCVQG